MGTAVAKPIAILINSSPLRILIPGTLLSLALGLVAVATSIPLNVAAIVVWAVLLGRTTLQLAREGRRRSAVGMVAIQTLLMSVVVTAASVAPVKTTERFLDRTISLPREEMTLAELAGDPNGPRPEWLPYGVSVSAPEDEREMTIRFGRSPLTIRQFVSAVESQSTLRRRFSHCGNGSTILWGGDCSFGLRLRPPPDYQ